MMIYELEKYDTLKKRVTTEELDNLAESLEKFLDTYWSDIYFQEEEDQVDIFKKIEQIAFALKARQYDQLFDDPSIIMTEEEMNRIT